MSPVLFQLCSGKDKGLLSKLYLYFGLRGLARSLYNQDIRNNDEPGTHSCVVDTSWCFLHDTNAYHLRSIPFDDIKLLYLPGPTSMIEVSMIYYSRHHQNLLILYYI